MAETTSLRNERRGRAAPLLASLILVVTVGFALGGLVYGVDTTDLWSIETLAFGAVGALIAIKRPENRLGWIALAIE